MICGGKEKPGKVDTEREVDREKDQRCSLVLKRQAEEGCDLTHSVYQAGEASNERD